MAALAAWQRAHRGRTLRASEPRKGRRAHKKTTARQTARMPRFFEDAANCFLEMAYVDMFCANVGLSTTYGISIFVWFLALCRVVAKKPLPREETHGGAALAG